jgi:hypothetical protein
VSHTEIPTERKPPSDGLNKEGTDLSKARKTRRKLERAVADAPALDAEAARAVSGKLSRVRLVLAGAPDAALDPEARKDLGSALEQAEAFASQVAALALQRDELVEQAEEAAKHLASLERKALMAAAKAEALERAREVESDGFEHIEKRLEVESQLRERMEDLARVSERLTQAEQLAQERLEAAQKTESKLAEERRRRLELQLELDALEERYEKFITSRAAIDQSAKTQKERFDQRTQRLYKALLMHEGGLGAELAKSTNELMEASESLIRLETDRSSLLRQVETLRVSLRRAKGLPDSAPLPEDEAISAKHERLFLAIDQLKEQLDRKLQDLVSNIEERLSKTAPAPATEPENTAENAIKRQTEFFPLVDRVPDAPVVEQPKGEIATEDTENTEPKVEAATELSSVSSVSSVAIPPDAASLEAPLVDQAPPTKESTAERLQRLLESGVMDTESGGLDELFTRQSRRLRGQEPPSSHHGVEAKPGDPPAIIRDGEDEDPAADLDAKAVEKFLRQVETDDGPRVAPATLDAIIHLSESGTLHRGPATFLKVAGRSPGSEPPEAPTAPAPVSLPPRRTDARSILRNVAARSPRPTAVTKRPAAVGTVDYRRAAVLVLVPLAIVLVSVNLLPRLRGGARPAAERTYAPGQALDTTRLARWKDALHRQAEAIKKGDVEPAPSSLVAFAQALAESAPGTPLRDALARFATEARLPEAALLETTQRLAVADQRITWARQKAVQDHLHEKEVVAAAHATCGANPLSRQDVDFYLDHEAEARDAWAEVVRASRAMGQKD